MLEKWFSRERACVTDDWSANHSRESDLRTIKYHKMHGPCYMTLRKFITQHNTFYDTLRPACNAMGAGCSWIYTHQLREIDLSGSGSGLPPSRVIFLAIHYIKSMYIYRIYTRQCSFLDTWILKDYHHCTP